MKLLFLISIVFVITLGTSQRKMEKKNRTERFVDIVGGKSINWIDLTYCKDSIAGVFYGSDKLTDGTSIYYSAPLNNLNITDGNIRFDLVAYSFSRESFDKQNSHHEHYEKQLGKLPSLLTFRQRFSGYKLSNKLVLKRISDMYDSRVDELTFVKRNRD